MISSVILIDGSNFYFKLKSMGFNSLLSFEFSSFVDYLTKHKGSVWTCYYVGKIRQDGSKKAEILHVQQQRLLTHLSSNKIDYKLGFLMKTDRYHEKGVDVQIATDILVTSYEKISSRIFLISSDTDLIPAIIKSKELGVHIRYVGFKANPSHALMKTCNSFVLLDTEELKMFITS